MFRRLNILASLIESDAKAKVSDLELVGSAREDQWDEIDYVIFYVDEELCWAPAELQNSRDGRVKMHLLQPPMPCAKVRPKGLTEEKLDDVRRAVSRPEPASFKRRKTEPMRSSQESALVERFAALYDHGPVGEPA